MADLTIGSRVLVSHHRPWKDYSGVVEAWNCTPDHRAKVRWQHGSYSYVLPENLTAIEDPAGDGTTSQEKVMSSETEKPKRTRKTKEPVIQTESLPAEAATAIVAGIAASQPAPAKPPYRTLAQRMNAVQQEVDYVQKEKRQGMRYSIVSHDAVTAKVRPILVKHGILYYPRQLAYEQRGNRTEVAIWVRFVSIDDKDDFIDVPSLGYGIDDQDKGPGKAISYGVKYALLKALGMETGDDPDLEQDVKLKEGEPPAAAAGNGIAKANAQHAEDADYVEGLTLRMVKCATKAALTELHVATKERREQIAARSPEAYKRYLDLMKQRASEIDAG